MKIKTTFIILLGVFAVLIAKAQVNNDFHYDYDAAGNRIKRITIPKRLASNDTTAQFKDYLAGHEIKIFPNPTQGKLTVQISGLDNSSPPGKLDGAIKVFDVSGKLIFSKTSLPESTDVDLTNQPNGHYFLTVFIDGKSTQWKIVKMN